MLAETSAQDLSKLNNVNFTEYTVRKRQGWVVRLIQIFHIGLRPISLSASKYFAKIFNTYLSVNPSEIGASLAAVQLGHRVLWLNPSFAVREYIDRLSEQRASLHIYFLDPVHRLGLSFAILEKWSSWAHLATYSSEEAKRFNIEFLLPYSPAISSDKKKFPDFDIVYVGSPTPKRLAWIFIINFFVWSLRRRSYLRLASRNSHLKNWFPRVFTERIDFSEYMSLCRRSRSILEMHERDAGGVTLRATLCKSLGVVHICNQPATSETLVLSLASLYQFLKSLNNRSDGLNGEAHSPPSLSAPYFDIWLKENFSE